MQADHRLVWFRKEAEQDSHLCYIWCGKHIRRAARLMLTVRSMFEKKKDSLLFPPVFPKSWKQRAPINFCITWPADHVTAQAPSERSAPTLSRLQWKTTAACSYCITSTTFLGLPPSLCLFVCLPPPLSLFLISLCQHIPQKPSPVSAFWTFLLDGKTEKREREKKKGCCWNMCQLANQIGSTCL